jgi:1-acyl-sn-glycerol-3-phosphate acyltransferase
MATQRELFLKHKKFVKQYMRFFTHFDALEESVLPRQPMLFVANHPTTTDPFLLPILVNDPIHILVINTAFEVPVLGKLIESAGHHRVSHEKSSGGKLVADAVQSLRDGNHVGVFPEGRLSPLDGSFHKAHSGAARIALESGALVVPVGIHNSPESFVDFPLKDLPDEPPIRWIVRGSYYMTVGQPMHLQGDPQNFEDVNAATKKIMNAITVQTQKSRLRMQAYPSTLNIIYRMLHKVDAIFS